MSGYAGASAIIYYNPLVEAEIKGVKFDFLKCLDLYHSKDLDSLVKRVVIHPGDTVQPYTE